MYIVLLIQTTRSKVFYDWRDALGLVIQENSAS